MPYKNREDARAQQRRYYLAHPEKNRGYQRQLRARVKVLKAAPCMDCGGTFPPECMDFDHRDPSTKTLTVSRLSGISWQRALAEVAKCDLVCANCHRIRTERRRSKGHAEDAASGSVQVSASVGEGNALA